MKKLITGLLIVFCVATLSGALMASDDAAAASAVVPLCQGCHGSKGEGLEIGGGMPAYPRLAGQIRSYLVQALNDYKNGARSNPMMGAIAKGLSDDDISNISAYYAQLK